MWGRSFGRLVGSVVGRSVGWWVVGRSVGLSLVVRPVGSVVRSFGRSVGVGRSSGGVVGRPSFGGVVDRRSFGGAVRGWSFVGRSVVIRRKKSVERRSRSKFGCLDLLTVSIKIYEQMMHIKSRAPECIAMMWRCESLMVL